jgi:hypothetical protein
MIPLVPVSRNSDFSLRDRTRGFFFNLRKLEKERPLNPHPSPHVLTRLDKESNADSTCSTYFIVLGGPISRRTTGHRVLRHLKTVRHDFFTPPHSTSTRVRARVVPSVSSLFPFLCFEEKGPRC